MHAQTHNAETAFSNREIKVGRRAIGTYLVVAALAIIVARVLPLTGWLNQEPAAVASTGIAEAQPLTDIG